LTVKTTFLGFDITNAGIGKTACYSTRYTARNTPYECATPNILTTQR
jgi:hypothetical protein